jgi:hypothetical protein
MFTWAGYPWFYYFAVGKCITSAVICFCFLITSVVVTTPVMQPPCTIMYIYVIPVTGELGCGLHHLENCVLLGADWFDKGIFQSIRGGSRKSGLIGYTHLAPCANGE